MIGHMSRSQRRELAAITGLAIVLTAFLTYPVLFRMANAARVDSFDGQFGIWSVAWVARTIVTDPAGLFDTNMFYPHRNTLAFGEGNIGAGILAVPVYWLSGNAVLAHNSVMVISFVLSVLGTFYLVRHLTGSPHAAIAPAIAYAFCPYVFSHFPHIVLLTLGGIPFSMLAFHRLVERQTAGRAVTLGAVLGAQGLASGYYGIFAGLSVGLGTLYFAIARGLWRRRSYWGWVAAAALVSIAIVLPFLRPYLELQRDTGFARPLEESYALGANWSAYLTSAAWAHRWLLPYLPPWKEVLFPGALATVLGLVGAWRGTRPTEARSTRDVAGFYVLLTGLALWASFGPQAGLYLLMYEWLPTFSLLHAPSRFGVVVVLGLSVLAGFAIEHAARSRPVQHRRAIGFVLALVATAELTGIPWRWTELPPRARAYTMLRMLPRGVVTEFPFFWRRGDFPRHAAYLLNSTYHWQPLVNGYGDFIPTDFREMVDDLGLFPTERGFERLRERDVRYLVFHLDQYDRAARRRLVERDLVRYEAYLRPLVRAGDVWLYEIIDWPG
jgi:hypothetical protein